MKYILTESQVPKVMKLFIQERFPTLMEPLMEVPGKLFKRTRTGLDIDSYYTRSYYYSDSDSQVWVVKNDNEDIRNSKYDVDSLLEPIYNMFGEKLFQEFFKEVHGIDLTDKGTKEYDWLFV